MILYGRWFTTRRMIAGRKRNPTISGESTNSVSIISRRFLAEGGGGNAAALSLWHGSKTDHDSKQ